MSGYRVPRDFNVLRRPSVFFALMLFAGSLSLSAAGLRLPGGLPDILKKDYQNQPEIVNFTGLNTVKQPTTVKSFIDNSIDEDAYYIGMGDVFDIAVIELPSVKYTAEVNQNGDVRISDFGIVPLGKISLRDAKKCIADFMQNKIGRGKSVYVSLMQGKMVSVSVNGVIAKPGILFVDGILHVWDCIVKANGGVAPVVSDADLRNVVVKNSDTTLVLDLYRFQIRNDATQNPYVYPGDRIFIGPPVRQVFIHGEVRKPLPGTYLPIRPGETLRDLCDVLVLDESADSSMIILQRGTTTAQRRDTLVSLSGGDAEVLLEGNDAITVMRKPDYPVVQTAYVTGAVLRSGYFPVVEQVTTVRELIDKCGGCLSRANPERMYLLRSSQKLLADPGEHAFDVKQESASAYSLGSVRPEMNLAFTRMNSLQDYAVIAIGQRGDSTKVEHGDQLVVPYNEPFVYVSGSVGSPGAYPYVKGESAGYYIGKAGGFTSKSDRRNVYVVSRYTTSVQMKGSRAVEEGDIVVVPDSPNNKVLNTFILPFLQIVSTAATIILAAASIIQTAKN